MRFMPTVGAGLLAGAMLAGCTSENDIVDNAKVYGTPNPPALVTPIKEDSIVQVPTPKVDVLFVIDNSCSMSEEQQQLATNFESFISYFIGSGLDWHVGVVSTDMDWQSEAGVLISVGGVRYLDETTPNPVDVFGAMAQLGTSGSATEKGRAAAYTALELNKEGPNKGFYRDEASLTLIAISDEQDQSGQNPISLNEFINWLRILKPSADMVSFSSIVTPPGGCNPGGWSPGTEYMAVTDAVGGIKWSICDQDWSEVLDQLGLLAAGLQQRFPLSDYPVPGTIQVKVIEGENTFVFHEGKPRDGYSFDYDDATNTIEFYDYIPSPMAEVIITYELLSVSQDSGSSSGANDDDDTDSSGRPNP